MASYTGTLSYDTTGGVQTLKEMTISSLTEIGSMFIDMSAASSSVRFRLWVKIDGTNYREIGQGVEVGAGDSVNLINAYADELYYTVSAGVLFADSDVKITAEEIPA